jgi:hypothetical protein
LVVDLLVLSYVKNIYIYICYSCTCVGADVVAQEPNLPHKCPMVSEFSRPNSQWRIIVRAPDWISSVIPRRGNDLAGSHAQGKDKRETLYQSGQIREVAWSMERTTKQVTNTEHTFQMINLIYVSTCH